MGDFATLPTAALLLFGAGSGFIGSGIGMMIGRHAKPSTPTSGRNSTLLSIAVGAVLVLVATYAGSAPAEATAPRTVSTHPVGS